MIRGQVSDDLEACVTLEVLGSDNRRRSTKTVVDTGFTGSLTLPARYIRELGLAFVGHTSARLADGSAVALRRFLARVDWLGQLREVVVLEAEGGPLCGMALLQGHDLSVTVRVGGRVEIIPS